jgi:hypothetical protein
MAFFKNQPTEPEPNGDSPLASSQLGKGSPLFKQDAGIGEKAPSPQLSLSDYISKHLKAAEEAATAKPLPQTNRQGAYPLLLPPAATTAPPGREGQFLNTIDGDLTAGLEQYMPTPLFRLRVTKKRLDTEISDLKGRLSKYERIPEKGKDLEECIQTFKERLRILEAHEAQVAEELSAMLTMGKPVAWFMQQFHGQAQWLPNLFQTLWRWVLQGRYGKAYVDASTATEELQMLQDVLAERLADPQVSQQELGRILSRYDQLYGQTRSALDKVSRRPERP